MRPMRGRRGRNWPIAANSTASRANQQRFPALLQGGFYGSAGETSRRDVVETPRRQSKTPFSRPKGTMSLLVKICGLSTRETLDVALDAGADMVGFVFFRRRRGTCRSRRRASLAVTPGDAPSRWR